MLEERFSLFQFSLPALLLGHVGHDPVVVLYLPLLVAGGPAADTADERRSVRTPKLDLRTLKSPLRLDPLPQRLPAVGIGVELGGVDLKDRLCVLIPEHFGEGLIGVHQSLIRRRLVKALRDGLGDRAETPPLLAETLAGRFHPGRAVSDQQPASHSERPQLNGCSKGLDVPLQHLDANEHPGSGRDAGAPQQSPTGR